MQDRSRGGKPPTLREAGKYLLAPAVADTPLSKWAYETPRFPDGIKETDLKRSDVAIQRETVLVWFLKNYFPETGPVFGFDGGSPPDRGGDGIGGTADKPYGGTGRPFPVTFGSPAIAGFDQAPFSSGRPSLEILDREFGSIVAGETVSEVSGVLAGLWLPREWDPGVAAALAEREYEKALPGLLSSLAARLQELRARSITRGDNRSPEGLVEPEGLPDEFLPITEPEKAAVIRATEKARLAVLSRDISAFDVAWKVAAPILAKIAEGVAEQIRLAAPILRTGMAALAIVEIGTGLHVVTHAEAINLALACIGGHAAKDAFKKGKS